MSCSRLDRLWSCPAHVTIDVESPPVGESAIIGTVLHWLLLERFPETLPSGMDEETTDLYYQCLQVLDQTPGTPFANEIYHETDILTGTADKTNVSDNGMRIMYIRDLKTGRTPVSAESKQLLGYSYLMWEKFDRRQEIFDVGIVQPKVYGNHVPTVRYGKKDLLDFEEELKEKLKQTDIFALGKGCDWCPAKTSGLCPVMNELLQTKG